MHECGIAHRDLKLENILVMGEHPENGIKISDFGLSRFFNAQTAMSSRVGSPEYVGNAFCSEKP